MVQVEYESNEWSASIAIPDPVFRGNLYHFLNQNVGKPVSEVGDLEIDF